MEKIGFIGMYDKIDMIIYVAKILTACGKKILVVDSTVSQKARYIVPVINPTVSYVTEFEGIDIAVGFKDFDAIKKYLYISEEKELPYDIVLINTDNNEGIRNFKLTQCEKNYFVTSFDMYSLKRGLEILNDLKEPLKLIKILFAQDILKEDDDYLNFLSLGYKVVWDENRIYFPIENGDLSIIYENQRVAKIKLKKMSIQYKDGLTYIVTDILKSVSEMQIRRIIKTIERGV